MGATIKDGYLYFQVTDDVEQQILAFFPAYSISDTAILKKGDEWGPWIRDMSIEEHILEISEWKLYSSDGIPFRIFSGIIIRRKLETHKKATRYQILKGAI